MERTFDFEKVMQPIWNDGGLAWCEPVAAAETAPGETLIPLYYRADEILSVQSADLRTTYEAGKDYALENGCPYLRMDTNGRNERARSFYSKVGYKETGIVPCVFNGIDGVNLVLLEKCLLDR